MQNDLVYTATVNRMTASLKAWIDRGVQDTDMQVVISIMGGYLTGLLRTFPPEEQNSAIATIITGLKMTPEQRAAYAQEMEERQSAGERKKGIIH